MSKPRSTEPEGRALARRGGIVLFSIAALQALSALVVAELARPSGAVAWVSVGGVAVGGAIVAALLINLFLRRDRARLADVRDLLAAANAGDLTVSSGSTHADEIGDLERGVDQLLGRMIDIVATVQQGLGRMHAARLSAAGVHKEMLDTAEMTAGQAYDAGVSSVQVSDSIHTVASSTEELVATVREMARHATLAADIAVTATEQGGVADRGVHELTAALEQVQKIADVIAAIAGQTHLLALNAMIEAARAGDAGLGFAVVASEVKALSQASADATSQVRAVVAGIHEVSGRASDAINQITHTMSLISESTLSIASTVTEHTATTSEIGRVPVLAAQGASDISERVAAVHNRARDVAYVGARNDAAKSVEFERLETAFRARVERYDVGSFIAVIDDESEIAVDQDRLNVIGTTFADGVTTVIDTVRGSDVNQFNYSGAWLHGDGYETDPGGDAYSSMPGDGVTLRFAGTRLRFHGCRDKQQGMAEVWIDDQKPVLVDFYSPDRAHQLLWESPDLPRGQHTFKLRVSEQKNPASNYFWVSVAKVEIVG